MSKIDTTLRQWCETCQEATVSRICSACFGSPLVCSACHRCDDMEEW